MTQGVEVRVAVAVPVTVVDVSVGVTVRVLVGLAKGFMARFFCYFFTPCSPYRESLAVLREMGDKKGIADSLEGLAEAAAKLGQPERAARIWGAEQALRDAIVLPLPATTLERQEEYMASTRAQLDELLWSAAREEGVAM